MVFKCCVTNCTTGYDKNKNRGMGKVAVFKFPTNEKMCEKWIKAIPRQNWVVTDSKRVCEKHFHAEDFQDTSTDTNPRRRRNMQKLQRRRLKPTAIPRIFPDLPTYLSSSASIPRPTNSSSSSARLALENVRLEQLNETLLQQDAVDSFAMFKNKLRNETVPEGFIQAVDDDSVTFHYIRDDSDERRIPKLLSSVVVKSNLEVKIFLHSAPLSHEVFKHVMPEKRLNKMSELLNILALCKSFADPGSASTKNENYIKIAVSMLECYVAQNEQSSFEAVDVALIIFLVEQLKLTHLPKQGRRYSSNLITTAFLWQLTSSSLYQKLCESFILPSTRRLQMFSSGNTVKAGFFDIPYLQQRTADLTPRERLVTLMMDEVYTAQRIEYSNGSFQGLTEEGLPSKTVLSFMVQSIHGKYKDVVCLIPVHKLDSSILSSWFHKVMAALHDFFLIVAVSADNHICNRKLFTTLCGGTLEQSIEHPTRHGERLFLLFDYTHNFKNMFNNFVNRGIMNIPTSGFEDILGMSCVANFLHIMRLYALEEDKTLKVAHALKKCSLNPSSIARTSPQHALSVFSESTVRGLQVYSEKNAPFLETARYVNFVLNIWKVMSLKTPSKAARKKDEMCSPLQFIEGQPSHSLQFIMRAKDVLLKWKQSGNAGLTSQTFLACIQSIEAMIGLVHYLQESHGFAYILPGKFMSDPIEARFGWYRQMNGGNFFMSVKQLLLAEKKIRMLSLLQQKALASAYRLSSKEFPAEVDTHPAESSIDCDWLIELLLRHEVCNLDQMATVDANVAYFISGYIGRSICRRRRCSACKDLLLQPDEDLQLSSCIPEEYTELFDMANRGGLSPPSEYCFAVTMLAVQSYTVLSSDLDTKTKFLSLSDPRSVFVTALIKAIEKQNCCISLLYQACSCDHINFETIVKSAFNCFAKNELKRLNSRASAEIPAKVTRSISKLSGKTTQK